LKLLTVLLFVELNTTMALAILTEQRGFVGVGQSCVCRVRQTVTGRGQGRGLWQFVSTPRLGLEV